jgi:hypothetical protein
MQLSKKPLLRRARLVGTEHLVGQSTMVFLPRDYSCISFNDGPTLKLPTTASKEGTSPSVALLAAMVGGKHLRTFLGGRIVDY